MLLAIVDAVFIFVPIGMVLFHQVAKGHPISDLQLLSVFSALLLSLILTSSLNLYDIAVATSFKKSQRATICAALIVFASKAAYADVLVGPQILDKYRFAIFAVVGLAMWRTFFAAIAHVVPLSKRVLVVGAGISGRLLAEAIEDKRRRGDLDYQLIGYVDDDPTKWGSDYAAAPVFGPSDIVKRIVQQWQVDTLALAVNREPVFSANVFSGLLDARECGIQVLSMPALYERLARKVALTHVGQNWGITFPLEDFSVAFAHGPVSRAIDIVTSVIGCVMVLLISPILMLANAIWSPGPLFYSQLRVGKGGIPFRIFKFRSMVVNAEAKGAVWCKEGDPRITKLGAFLRKTRIDELPQFWNVLKGEMSLIGPRPERPEFTDILSEKIPFYRARHAMKPGLTGWAQVMYRYGSSEEDALTKLEFDLYYVKHRSIALDLHILAKSVITVCTAAGR